MKLSILFLLALAISCVSAQSFLFGEVSDLSSRSSSSCATALFDIFGPGCTSSGDCSVPNHGVGITITTSNSRTKETTFLRGCLQIDTFGPTGLVLTNIASPGTWGVLSSEAVGCCSGRSQPFDVSQLSFSINYLEIDQVGRVFVRSTEGLETNFTLTCPNCGSFPAVGFAGELTIVFQFSLFPGAACPEVPIATPCSGGSDTCDCPTTGGGGGDTGSGSEGGDGASVTTGGTGAVITGGGGGDGAVVTSGDGDNTGVVITGGDGAVVTSGDGDNTGVVITGGDGAVVTSGDGSVQVTTGDDNFVVGGDGSAASTLRAFYFL